MTKFLDTIDGQVFPREQFIHCPLCGNRNEPRQINAQFDMVALFAYCAPCRLGYQSPRPTEEASAAYMNWRWRSGSSYTSDTPAKRRRAVKALDIAKRANPDAKTLLDFGAGSGIFVRECLEVGMDATGVELSDGAIEQAEKIGVVLHKQIPDRKFDLITMWDVVEHLRDPKATLEMLRPYLAPGGLLLMETGNYENWLREFQGDSWSLYLFDHQFYFTPESLKMVSESAGYSSFRLTDAGSTPPSKRWAYMRPLHYLKAHLAYIKARQKWPQHGHINVMVAVAGN